MNKENIGYARICAHFVHIRWIFYIKNDKIVLKIQKVTCPQTLENKENTQNIISMDNILIWPAGMVLVKSISNVVVNKSRYLSTFFYGIIILEVIVWKY